MPELGTTKLQAPAEGAELPARLLPLLDVEDVAAVHKHLLVDELRRPPRVHFLELLPLGGEDDQLRATQCILEAGGVVEGGEDLAGVVHALRVVDAHACSGE